VSCDLKPTENPGPHHQGDVRKLLHEAWDLMIAHPECKYLTNSAEWAYGDGPYHQKVKPETLVGAARRAAREEAVDFFLRLWTTPIKHICIENPVGHLSRIEPYSQIIQPYQFGDDASKKTCLWLKGLPPLKPTKYIAPRIVCGKPRWANQTDSGQNRLSPGPDRSADRAVTYQGIADAMAEQWGNPSITEIVFPCH
jgi:hypothetical protein